MPPRLPCRLARRSPGPVGWRGGVWAWAASQRPSRPNRPVGGRGAAVGGGGGGGRGGGIGGGGGGGPEKGGERKSSGGVCARGRSRAARLGSWGHRAPEGGRGRRGCGVRGARRQWLQAGDGVVTSGEVLGGSGCRREAGWRETGWDEWLQSWRCLRAWSDRHGWLRRLASSTRTWSCRKWCTHREASTSAKSCSCSRYDLAAERPPANSATRSARNSTARSVMSILTSSVPLRHGTKMVR